MCCEIHDKIPNEILEKLPSAFLEMWVGWNSLRSAKKNPEKKCLGKIYVKFSKEKNLRSISKVLIGEFHR